MKASRGLSRRDFVRSVGLGVFGISFIPWFEGCETNSVQPLTQGSDFPFITTVETMYVQNGAQANTANWTMPQLNPGTWTLVIKLTVAGSTTQLLSMSLADLNALAANNSVTILKTLQCVYDAPLLSTPTGLTGNAYWTGVPLRAVLDQVTVDLNKVKRLHFKGADGFNNNLHLSRLYTAQPADLLAPVLVTQMNGAPLAQPHGFPVRMIVPEMFGFKNVKWLTELEFTDDDSNFGTYQSEGFFDDGTLGVNSRMMRPVNNMNLSAGQFQISGFAISGAAGISAVEISVDDGPWQTAEIVTIEEISAAENLPTTVIEQIKQAMKYPYRGVWSKWRFMWTATSGSHKLALRATDGAGNVQPAVDNNVADGTNPISIVNVTVA